MKIAVLLGDGMSGNPLEEKGGKTTLQLANTPNMDRLAAQGTLGLTHTVPKGYPAGSDVANLSVFGYDPASCYTGRAPLEAAAMGVELGPKDVAYRMNLVTLIAGTKQVFMHDFSAGHITTEEARRVVETISKELSDEGLEFYPGVSYRHLFVWRDGETEAVTIPPHDIIGQAIQDNLPKGPGADLLLGMMTGSQMLLKGHPVNVERFEAGKEEANSIWLWGQGTPPKMETYADKYGLTGAVISAVDLLRGIGKMAGLYCPIVEGATGWIDTNYEGKRTAALEALVKTDFVYLHVEAPDEAGHTGDADMKIKAIEDFDREIVGPMWEELERRGEEYALLVMPDHPTPVALRTHTHDPVPFALLEKGKEAGVAAAGKGFTEQFAGQTGLTVECAHTLMDHIAGGKRLW
jgi:2,3-bisphosphoglycerate-independent phosphoglycerate mutase